MRATAESYLRQLQALLPPGRAWPRDEEATLTRLLRAAADGLARIDARASGPLREADPRAAAELLPDWERVLGLPDTCTPAGASLAQRRAAAHAKLTDRGGQSRAYFIALAGRLGFDIGITEFSPFTCQSACADPATSPTWRFAWRVEAPETTVLDMTCRASCNDPLRTWGNARLECEIRRRQPAHTHLLFAYGG